MACSTLARTRAAWGARSRMLMFVKSERRAGSFSTAHMIASASLIRIGSGSREADGGASAPCRLACDLGVLELVQASPVEQPECPLEIVDAVALHEPDEHGLVALDERGDAERLKAVDLLGVLGGERLQRTAAPRLLGDGVDVEAGGAHGLTDDVLVAELLAVVVAGGERGDMEVEEALGELVTDGDAVEEGGHARAPFAGLAVPHRRFAFLDVRLVERERQEPDVEVGAVAQGRDDRFVGVAGEGAAVVEADGDLAGHRETSGTGTVLPADVRNPQVTPAIPASKVSARAWRSARTRGRAACPRPRRKRGASGRRRGSRRRGRPTPNTQMSKTLRTAASRP